MLLGLISPTGGSGQILGHSIDDPDEYLKHVGAMIEGPAFYPALSGAENLHVLATVGGFSHERVTEVLTTVGLADRAQSKFKTYSLGMKQRLAIAAALLGKPDILVLDEPTNGLDPAGIAEIIKYGPIADESFFSWMEDHLEDLQGLNTSALAYAIRRSCEIKADVVGKYERESGIRAILNFGHTYGHAIEAGLGYGKWLHGEAVGCGMVMAANLSFQLGLISQDYAHRIRRLVMRANLPVSPPKWSVEKYLDLMLTDKKAEAGALRFVTIDAPGRAGLREVDASILRKVIESAL
jgi:hypothetical protein